MVQAITSTEKEVEMRQFIPVLKLVLFVGWAVLAVLALMSCATMRPIPVVFDSALPVNYGAVTTCDTIANMPIVSVQANLRNQPGLAPTLMHEMIHAKQAMRHRGGCREFMRKYTREASFQLEVEAEAYCGVLMTYGNPSEYTQNVVKTTLQLWESYGQKIGLTPDQSQNHAILPWYSSNGRKTCGKEREPMTIAYCSKCKEETAHFFWGCAKCCDPRGKEKTNVSEMRMVPEAHRGRDNGGTRPLKMAS